MSVPAQTVTGLTLTGEAAVEVAEATADATIAAVAAQAAQSAAEAAVAAAADVATLAAEAAQSASDKAHFHAEERIIETVSRIESAEESLCQIQLMQTSQGAALDVLANQVVELAALLAGMTSPSSIPMPAVPTGEPAEPEPQAVEPQAAEPGDEAPVPAPEPARKRHRPRY